VSAGNGDWPAGWESVTIGDVVVPKVEQGTPSTDFTYIDIGSVNNKTKQIDSAKDIIAESKVPSRAQQHVQAGDILVSMTRPNLNAVAKVPTELGGAICSTGFDVLRSIEVEPDWLFLIVKSRPFVEAMTALVQGALYPAVRPADVRAYKFALPPLAEQRRIVAKIEALQERSRRAREALAEVRPLLEQFRQSVLAAAFRGDLTADWRAAHPNVEPASELLHRIRTERRHQWEQAELAKYEAKGQKPPKNWKDKYKEPEPVDDSDLPELPEVWCWTRLPELGYMNRGKSRHRPRNAPHLYGGPYPFVQTGDIAQSRGRIVSHKQTYSEAGLAQSKLWPEGTVCITIAANIASSAVLSYPASFPDSVVGLIPDESLCSPEFVEFFIRTAKGDLERFAPSTAQKNINLETLTEVAVPLPPLEESKEITRLLTELIDGAFHIDEVVASLIEQIDQLDESILAKAFRGELVAQDPSDEPASMLLERIRAQQTQQAYPIKGNKKISKSQPGSNTGKKSSRLTPQQLTLAEVLTTKD
jgi:type I restriction enzyme, S subunit